MPEYLTTAAAQINEFDKNDLFNYPGENPKLEKVLRPVALTER